MKKCICGGEMEKFPHHTYGCKSCGFMIKESEIVTIDKIIEWRDDSMKMNMRKSNDD